MILRRKRRPLGNMSTKHLPKGSSTPSQLHDRTTCDRKVRGAAVRARFDVMCFDVCPRERVRAID
jgi:hypothetical protein